MDTKGEVVPISKWVRPEFDGEFEFTDWFTRLIRQFVEEHGHPPHSIALVMADDKIVVPKTWTPDKAHGYGRMMMAGLAIASLSRHATDD